jgi:hypothetical protein
MIIETRRISVRVNSKLLMVSTDGAATGFQWRNLGRESQTRKPKQQQTVNAKANLL